MLEKHFIRSLIKEKRQALSLTENKIKSNKIMDIFINSNLYKESESIFTFVSFKDEVSTHNLIDYILKDDKILLIPSTDAKSKLMTPHHIKDFNRDLILGNYNIMEPKDTSKIFPYEKIDIILVPGLAFDPYGYRIGYGGGYYDKFFAKDINALKIGLCFDLQLIDKCPKDTYDIPVDFIITESGIKKVIK